MHLQTIVALVVISHVGLSSAQTGSRCNRSCGNVTIPYPFGSYDQEGCYYDDSFRVNCSRSSDHEYIPYFGNLALTNISLSNGEVEVMMFVAYDCYNSSGYRANYYAALNSTNYQISTKNKFVAIGCDTHAYIEGSRENETDGTGCISICEANSNIANRSCSGVGCCKVAIPENMTHIRLAVSSYNNHTHILDFNPCSYAFVVNEEKYSFSSNDLLDFGVAKEMPMLLDWAIGNLTCNMVNNEADDFLCKGKSECDPDYYGTGYRCRCVKGYEGNPYVENNCTNINECNNHEHNCTHTCHDIEGSYVCKCPKGYSGDGMKNGSGTLASILFLLVFITWVYVGVKKHKAMKLREKFFKQNGGIMLQQRISRDQGSRDQAKVFTIEELRRATDNYDESRIIGKGGYGTVYKGILTDNRIVAIKKSKLVDQTQAQIEQFINEVVILSQINHRNVVKLIGCCLETEIPSLIYEFIPNGTLSDHIHNESKSSAIAWDIRLRIATGTAGALSYLHSAASVPIIHRDVKPMNILLDDDYVAKVADFGASRFIPMDQIELATIVQGTLGYLDPEYLQTNQLTDKSDVYSFGVVLVELLTGRKALCFDKPEGERNLAKYYLSSLKEGRLCQVLDAHLQLNEVPTEIIQVSRLAERCLHVKGDERPTMKEVAIELEGILASTIHKHPWDQSTSNEKETEYLLGEPMEDCGYPNEANTSSSTFDSMSKHTILPIASGR